MRAAKGKEAMIGAYHLMAQPLSARLAQALSATSQMTIGPELISS